MAPTGRAFVLALLFASPATAQVVTPNLPGLALPSSPAGIAAPALPVTPSISLPPISTLPFDGAVLPAWTGLPKPELAASVMAGRIAARAAAREFPLVVRRGLDRFGRTVVVIDALDPADPGKGTVGHVDIAIRDDQASLDQPLDSDVAGSPTTDLSHWRQGLWFGFAVLPEHQRTGLGARLLDEAERILRDAGVRRLFITATDSSRPYYLKRYGARVRVDEPRTDRDGDTLHSLEVELQAAAGSSK